MNDNPERRSILVVEDHDTVRNVLVDWLVNSLPEIEIIPVRTGMEAVSQIWSNKRIELVLMDIGLPGINGLEATRRLKGIRPELKVIMLSMHGEPSYIEEAKLAGASAFVRKCDAPSDLRGVLHDMLTTNSQRSAASKQPTAGEGHVDYNDCDRTR